MWVTISLSVHSILLCCSSSKPQKLEAENAGISEPIDAGASSRLSTLSVEGVLSGRSGAARSVMVGPTRIPHYPCWLQAASRACLLADPGVGTDEGGSGTHTRSCNTRPGILYYRPAPVWIPCTRFPNGKINITLPTCGQTLTVSLLG